MPMAYPYAIDQQHRTATTANIQYIEQLIEQMLFTMPGERVNRPDFGSNLMQLVFAPQNDELIASLRLLLQGVLQRWLGNINRVESININAQEQTLTITVQYFIQNSQERQISQCSRSF